METMSTFTPLGRSQSLSLCKHSIIGLEKCDSAYYVKISKDRVKHCSKCL